MNERVKLVAKNVSIETLEVVRKNMKERDKYIKRVYGNGVEQYDVWKDVPDYLYYNVYRNHRKMSSTSMHYSFEPLNDFMHNPYLCSAG